MPRGGQLERPINKPGLDAITIFIARTGNHCILGGGHCHFKTIHTRFYFEPFSNAFVGVQLRSNFGFSFPFQDAQLRAENFGNKKSKIYIQFTVRLHMKMNK